MVKISGGVPGGWHGGQLPGASAPFRFRFDAQGEAEVEGDVASYLMSVPGPFALVAEFSDIDDGSGNDDTTPDTSETPQEPVKPKRTSNRKKSLDE